MAETLTAVVKKMLDKEGIEAAESGDPPALGFGVQGDNGEWACFVRVDEERQVVAFYSLSPISAEESRMADMVELVTRANWGLAVGNIEIDLDDGEIRVKTSMDLEGAKPSPALLKRMLYANLGVMDLFLPAFAMVQEGKSAEEALDAVDSVNGDDEDQA